MQTMRRKLLVFGSAIGATLTIGGLQRALAAGRVPLVQGMNRVNGTVLINGSPAQVGQLVSPGDTITTGANSDALYVIGDNVFMQRGNSIVRAEIASTAKIALRLVSGALASVFGSGEHQIQTSTATVGIRGTAAYLESANDLTYFCLCYGRAAVTTTGQPGQVTELVTRYHDTPFYIGSDGILRSAPVINHTDAELIMLEGVVGRRPPFTNDPTRTGY